LFKRSVGTHCNQWQPIPIGQFKLRDSKKPSPISQRPLEHQYASPSNAQNIRENIGVHGNVGTWIGLGHQTQILRRMKSNIELVLKTYYESLRVPSIFHYNSASDVEMGYAKMDMSEEEIDNYGFVEDVTSIQYMYRNSM